MVSRACSRPGQASRLDSSMIMTPILLPPLQVIEGYLLEIPGGYDAIVKAIAHAKSAGALVALTAADASCVTRHLNEFWSLIHKGVDILLANDKEACELVGCDKPGASTIQLGHHIPLVSVTRGASGSDIVLNGRREKIAPNRNGFPAVDTCGAGNDRPSVEWRPGIVSFSLSFVLSFLY